MLCIDTVLFSTRSVYLITMAQALASLDYFNEDESFIRRNTVVIRR